MNTRPKSPFNRYIKNEVSALRSLVINVMKLSCNVLPSNVSKRWRGFLENEKRSDFTVTNLNERLKTQFFFVYDTVQSIPLVYNDMKMKKKISPFALFKDTESHFVN